MSKSRPAALGVAFPDAYRQLAALDSTVNKAAQEAGLDPILLDLVKLRVSQLNGCAFCVDLHSRDARTKGEAERRVHLVTVWREVDVFSAPERAAFALAEAMTNLPLYRDVPDEVYDHAATVFEERQLTTLVWAITVINAFNRLGVTGRPPLLAERK